ncbi:MAG: hypothetical protein QW338_03785 [Conexivisphaerales archaeon]
MARGRAPFRISFGGGGTDVPPYCWESGGAVLNATIDRYAYSSLEFGGNMIRVRSVDLNEEEQFNAGRIKYGGKLDLIAGVINQFSNGNGMYAETYSEMPAGSGMGTSSAIAVSLIAAFSEALKKGMSKYEIAMLAHHVEREELGQLGGYQDQFTAAYGGLNLMEFSRAGVKVTRVNLLTDVLEEFQYRTLMFYTGRVHFSSDIHRDMKDRYDRDKNEVYVRDELKRIAYELHRALLSGDLDGFGELVNENWELKKKMSEKISNKTIDRAYEMLLRAGALGGKIQGAGGGGYLLMFVKRDKRAEVLKHGMEMGLEPFSFRFEMEGARSWKVE